MKIIVEYNKYNTNMDKASIPSSNDMDFELEINEERDKATLMVTHGLSDDLIDIVTSVELTRDNVLELSKLFMRMAQSIEIKPE